MQWPVTPRCSSAAPTRAMTAPAHDFRNRPVTNKPPPIRAENFRSSWPTFWAACSSVQSKSCLFGWYRSLPVIEVAMVPPMSLSHCNCHLPLLLYCVSTFTLLRPCQKLYRRSARLIVTYDRCTSTVARLRTFSSRGIKTRPCTPNTIGTVPVEYPSPIGPGMPGTEGRSIRAQLPVQSYFPYGGSQD